jgi:hypothetical protein
METGRAILLTQAHDGREEVSFSWDGLESPSHEVNALDCDSKLLLVVVGFSWFLGQMRDRRRHESK